MRKVTSLIFPLFAYLALDILISPTKVIECSTDFDRILYSDLDDDPPGFWGPWEDCGSDTYVTGFKLKTENSRFIRSRELETGDTFGISGVELICGIAGNKSHTRGITSNVAAEGEWTDAEFCEGYAVGFEVKTGKEKGGDFVGPTNLRFLCSARKETIGQHLDYDPGTWSDKIFCLRNQGICGIRTKTKYQFDDEDLVGISSINFKCCYFVSQSTTCIPTDGYELLFDFDNTHGLQPVTYSYSMSVGVAISNSKKDGHSKVVSGSGNLGAEYQVGNASREVDGRRRRRRDVQFIPKFRQIIPTSFPLLPIPVSTPSLQPSNPFPVPPPNPIPPGISPVEPPPFPPPGLNPGSGRPRPGNENLTASTDILRIYSLDAAGTLTSGYDWKTSSSDTWAPTRSTKVGITILPGHSVSVYQVVGVCGDIIIRAEKIFQNGSYLGSEAKMAMEEAESWGFFLYITNMLSGISSVFDDFFSFFRKLKKFF